MTTAADLHKDHIQWASDHETWLTEIDLWQQQHQQALADLTRLELAFREHGPALMEHASRVRLNNRHLMVHEHALASMEQGGGTDPLADAHEDRAKTHERVAGEHARIKAHHERALAALRKAIRAVNEAL